MYSSVIPTRHTYPSYLPVVVVTEFQRSQIKKQTERKGYVDTEQYSEPVVVHERVNVRWTGLSVAIQWIIQ